MNENKLQQALGPLAEAYLDDTVQEIMVDGPGKVYVERGGQLEDLKITFDSGEALIEMIEAVAAAVGAAVAADAATVDIRLPDNSRFRAVLPPTAVDGPYLTILKPFLGRHLTWEKLLEYGSVSPEVIEIIDSALAAEANILISGGTASGKTTLLNMVTEKLPAGKRIVAVENVHELDIQHPRAVYLEANAAQQPMAELIEAACLMTPHCLVVNDLQGAEAFTMLQKFNSGYFGIGSMHAESAQDALTRLETQCLMANQGLSLVDIRRLVAGGVRLVVQIMYLPDGRRRVVEMVEVQGLHNDRLQLQPLLRFNSTAQVFEQVAARPGWV